jgi:adenylate cyclase
MPHHDVERHYQMMSAHTPLRNGRSAPVAASMLGQAPIAEVATLSFPIPANETQRLVALRAFDILDSAPEIAYDEIAELAAYICHCPIAYISFIDDDRRWLKARYGLGPELIEIPRATSMCTTAICGSEVLVVRDIAQDPRFNQTPVAMADPPCRFYCGLPLITDEGYAVRPTG